MFGVPNASRHVGLFAHMCVNYVSQIPPPPGLKIIPLVNVIFSPFNCSDNFLFFFNDKSIASRPNIWSFKICRSMKLVKSADCEGLKIMKCSVRLGVQKTIAKLLPLGSNGSNVGYIEQNSWKLFCNEKRHAKPTNSGRSSCSIKIRHCGGGRKK